VCAKSHAVVFSPDIYGIHIGGWCPSIREYSFKEVRILTRIKVIFAVLATMAAMLAASAAPAMADVDIDGSDDFGVADFDGFFGFGDFNDGDDFFAFDDGNGLFDFGGGIGFDVEQETGDTGDVVLETNVS
jgi:hypothetical protein